MPRQLDLRAVRVARLLLLAFPVLLPLLSRGASAQVVLRRGESFEWSGCYARLDRGELVVGNTHIVRRWKVEGGQLFPESLRDLASGREWMGDVVTQPAPSPPELLASGSTDLSGADGVFDPTEEHALQVQLQAVSSSGTVRYHFEVFPEASGIRMWLERSGSAVDAASSNASSAESRMPSLDALERLRLTSPHLRLIQVTLRDRTDERNELAFENEWLLHPNEAGLRLPGNLFVLEDVLTRSGMIFLKEAPQPEMRPIPSAQDLVVEGGGMSGPKRTDGRRPAYDVALTGHGFAGDGRGYPFVVLTYAGGEPGRIAALHQYQRQVRSYLPGRDGLLITNTWGDRSGSSRINIDFVKHEIDGAKLLGADLMQVDDGWESGKTTASHDNRGIWEGYWSQPNFWTPDPARFPGGLEPAVNYAHSRGLKLGLWFGPDSSHNFGNWGRDVSLLMDLHTTTHIDAFKLDSVKIRSKTSEVNYRHLLDGLQRQTNGALLLDLDVTAETRQGYFGNIAAGPLFVENRYTDLHRYWPHQTLRNFWKLSHYVDPVRLRMEFLNNERNAALYPDDPLAPAQYDPACLFAMTMFGSPLGWFETTGLSPQYRAAVRPLIATWKQHRDAIYQGVTLPVGDVPDGINWTGFSSLDDRGNGYLLVFRERNESADWVVPAKLPDHVTVLGGSGSMRRGGDGRWIAHVDKPLGFLWVKFESSGARQ